MLSGVERGSPSTRAVLVVENNHKNELILIACNYVIVSYACQISRSRVYTGEYSYGPALYGVMTFVMIFIGLRPRFVGM